MKTFGRMAFAALGAAFASALNQELSKPPRKRKWHGTVWGFVPYDFRLPSAGKLREAWWSPGDRRIVTPRVFGIGWAINLARVAELARAPVSTPPSGRALPFRARLARRR
ncbi:MAG TPA: DUF5808 domain-containing protein [Actinomycetota bacterium]|nr:DUF5808 domain-containing protein [Actinomycetota bacterium]